ncbi:MAG: ATP-binding protein, partial [Clostridiaceae bacterium]|nr:ATP-binding protein [Clostridiaceae bacterium]
VDYFKGLSGFSIDLEDIQNKLKAFHDGHINDKGYFNMPPEKKLIEFKEQLKSLIDKIKVATYSGSINADSPIYFDINKLPNYLERLAEIRGNQLTQFANLLNLRLRSILEDIRIKDVINPAKELDISEWLKVFVQSNKSKGQLSIFDLSLVPNEIIHLIISIISRIIFEALQRFRKHSKNELLPTVLVLEEAHTFIRRYDGSDEISPQRICCQTFERIAREGRKFGMGLMLSSQRPSELSATVLSQCNTFLLHRIVNDEDQRLVKKLVPDNLGGLLDELPILPTKKAILVGWAAPIPVLIEINNLPKNQQPASTDPNYWDVWIGKHKIEIDWEKISNDWQGNIIDEPENINDNDILDDKGLPF